MPVVPTYDGLKTTLQPGNTFRDPTHATGDMFGAGVGQGLAAIGAGLGEAASAMQQIRALDDVNAAKEADNKYADWMRNRMYGEGGFMGQQGRAAVDGSDQFSKDAAAARTEFGKGLSPGAQRHYADASSARLNSGLQTGMIHTMDQRKTWFTQSSDARAVGFANDALVGYQNPAEVEKSLAAGIMELREQGRMKGWDADTLRQKEIDYASGIHKNITLRIAQSDPIRAEAYRQENAKFLTGADQYALDGHLQKAVLEEQSRREADGIMAGGRDMATLTIDGESVAPTIGVRNNNPGNIKYFAGSSSARAPGVVGPSRYKDEGTPQIAFQTPQDGMNAMYGLLKKKYDGGLTTTRQIITDARSGWTPGFQGAAGNIAKLIGKGVDDDINLGDPKEAARFMRALITQEHGKAGKAFTDDQIDAAISGSGAPAAVGSQPATLRPGPTKDRAFLLSRLTDGHDPSHVNALDGAFATNLSAMIQDAPPDIREGLGIFSGFRSEERQAELWQDALKKYGSAEAARKWVAPPGHSQHNLGRAADLSWNGQSLARAPKEVVDWVHQNAARYGLHFPLANENWHVEPIGSRDGAGAVTARSDTVSPRASMPSYDDIERGLQSIPDSRLRDLTRQRIEQMMAMRVRAAEQSERAAKAELWRYVDQGKTPDDVPFDIRQAAGMASVSSAWDYAKKRADGSFATSDPVLLYDMRRYAATNPEDFARLDLNDYRDRLARPDLDELTRTQSSALTDMRKARDEGMNLTSAFSQAERQLEAVGIKTGGEKRSTEEKKRVADFNNALAEEMATFKQANQNKAPTQSDVQKMINKLLLPIVVHEDRSAFNPLSWFGEGRSSTDKFLFEARTRPDGSSAEFAVKYDTIPNDLRSGISLDLERELGRKPSRIEVAQRYAELVASMR